MAAIIKRTMEGEETRNQDGKVTSASIKFFVVSPTTRKEAMDACWEAAPDHYDTVKNPDGTLVEDTSSIEKSSVRFDGIEGDGCYGISVLYEEEQNDGSVKSKGKKKTDYLSNYTFDCTGGTRHVTHNNGQTIIYGKLDPGGAIGWNGKFGSESQVAGVDLPAANIRETYTRVMSASAGTVALRDAAKLVGKINSTTFKGWSPGECMFLGCSVNANGINPDEKKKKITSSAQSDGDKEVPLISITYHFAIRLNEDDLSFPELDSTVSKQGYEYIWSISETVADGSSPKLKVKGIFLEKDLCKSADLNSLKIPEIKFE